MRASNIITVNQLNGLLHNKRTVPTVTQRYVFLTTFAIVDVIFLATFNYFDVFFSMYFLFVACCIFSASHLERTLFI